MSVISYLGDALMSFVDVYFLLFVVLYGAGMLFFRTGRDLLKDIIAMMFHRHHHV